MAPIMSMVDGAFVGGLAMLFLGDPTLRHLGLSSLCICTCATFIWLVLLGILTLTVAALVVLKVAHRIDVGATHLMKLVRRGFVCNFQLFSVKTLLCVIKHVDNYQRKPRLLPVIAVVVLFFDDTARSNCSMLVCTMFLRGWHSSAGCPFLSTTAAVYLAWDSVPIWTLPVIMATEFSWPTFAGVGQFDCVCV
jgi:hypothetical protein